MDNLRFNGEHYRDKTAEKAIRRAERKERKRAEEALRDVERTLFLHGYELKRIEIRNVRTGVAHTECSKESHRD